VYNLAKLAQSEVEFVSVVFVIDGKGITVNHNLLVLELYEIHFTSNLLLILLVQRSV
jgi:hypothetical protein